MKESSKDKQKFLNSQLQKAKTVPLIWIDQLRIAVQRQQSNLNLNRPTGDKKHLVKKLNNKNVYLRK